MDEGLVECLFYWVMKMARNDQIKLPSIEYINEAVEYNSATGGLFWKIRPLAHFKNPHGMNTFNSKHAGKSCTAKHASGYFSLRLDGRTYLVHRVIWKIITGDDPVSGIDHKDTCKSNNKWANLRLANKSENGCNVSIKSRNKTGYKGVSFDTKRNKFFASIAINGKTKALGRFDSAELAHQAYIAASTKIHGEFGRFN